MGKVREPKFEEAIEELESIIAKIESGDCGLEECIAEYERGVKLLGRCQSILQVVQQRITELTAGPGGKLHVKAASASVDDKGSDDDNDGATPPLPGAIPGTIPGVGDDDNLSANE